MESKLLSGTQEVIEKVTPPVASLAEGMGGSFWALIGIALACLMWGRRVRRILG